MQFLQTLLIREGFGKIFKLLAFYVDHKKAVPWLAPLWFVAESNDWVNPS
jgi:hypothetical protein